MHEGKRSFWDKFWEDKNGRLAIWQKPNALLIIWAVSVAIQILLGSGRISDVVRIIGTVSIAIWALLEIISGSSYFRRILGACVLAFTALMSLLSL